MTQMDVLVSSVAELLSGAVHDVLRLMGRAVSQYREESARIHQENHKLQRTLDELRAELRGSEAAQRVPPPAAAEDSCSHFVEERPATSETRPRTAPGSPAPHAPSQRRSRPPDPVVTETPGSPLRMKAEPMTALPGRSAADVGGPGGATVRDPPRPPGPACPPGERPYACARCRFRFSRLPDLKKHERVHAAERPYGCSLCGRRFNRTENLRRHTRKVHHGTLV